MSTSMKIRGGYAVIHLHGGTYIWKHSPPNKGQKGRHDCRYTLSIKQEAPYPIMRRVYIKLDGDVYLALELRYGSLSSSSPPGPPPTKFSLTAKKVKKVRKKVSTSESRSSTLHQIRSWAFPLHNGRRCNGSRLEPCACSGG